jgi:hypothetical protein
MIETLSGNGSRTAVTAGTAEERTFELDARQRQGNGVFTAALLTAFHTADMSRTTLVTISDLYARVEEEMAKFRVRTGTTTHPHLSRLNEDDYRGTFVFLNARSELGHLTTAEFDALGAVHVAKDAEAPAATKSGTGVIQIFSTQSGEIFIGGRYKGEIVRGGSLTFQRQAPETYEVQLRTSSGAGKPPAPIQSKDVIVESGKIAPVTFGTEPPFDRSGRIPVGTLVIEATHDLGGEVSVDNYDFGQLKADGQISIPDLMAGTHKLQIDQGDRIITYPVVITANQTEHVVFGPSRPAPPTGLTATVY